MWRTIGCGPVYIAGSSTGGAIAQVIALEHPDVFIQPPRSLQLTRSICESCFYHFSESNVDGKKIIGCLPSVSTSPILLILGDKNRGLLRFCKF